MENWIVQHGGELLVGGPLAVLGWILAKFTDRHIRSMDNLAMELKHIARDVNEMKGDIRVIKEHQLAQDLRLDLHEDRLGRVERDNRE